MFSAEQANREIVAYRMKLVALSQRFHAGERSTVGLEARDCGDALITLMEEAPLPMRAPIDYLIDRYEALRSNCLS